tara:strand:- start:197 stop:427 length:231 start_codon:yes stop_codon:yes gene_type:complete
MKEQTLLEMKNKVETLGKVTQFLMQENKQLKDLSVGTLETVKKLPGYDKAIEELKQQLVKESGEAEEADSGRKIIE